MDYKELVIKILDLLPIGNVISSGHYKKISKKEAGKISKVDDIWKAEELPDKQFQIVKKQLEEIKRTRKFAVPYWPAIDLIKKTKMKSPKVLEIGCSSGYYGEVFKLAGLSLRYEGCDYSQFFIDLAKKLYPKTKFRVEDATQLSYKNQEFDIGISGCCILHIRNYSRAIEETARVSKNFMLFHRTPVIHLAKTSYFQKKGYGVDMLEIIFNESELLGLFWQNGFALVDSITLHQSKIAELNEPVFIKSYLVKRINGKNI